MGRRPTRSDAVPRLRKRRQKSGVVHYYYDHGLVDGKRREEPLGPDYGLAIKRWAEIERAGDEPVQAVITFRFVAERYRIEVMPGKASRTQRDNAHELENLLEFFDDPPGPLDAIEPIHVKQYLRWRNEAPVRANREKALLSHIWNFAREKGYTRQQNPCAGIKGNREDGRDVYVEEEEYAAIWEQADIVTREAMDVAYLTGQRPGDVVRMTEADIRGGMIRVVQAKTGQKVPVRIEGQLLEVIDRIKARKATHTAYNTRLIVNETGRPIGVHALSERFRKAREAAGLPHIQFRDLRAKAGTDKEEATGNVREAQLLLGHTSVRMTEKYIRKRRGKVVTPTR